MFLLQIDRPYLIRYFFRFPVIKYLDDEYLVNLNIIQDNWKAAQFVEICHRLDLDYYYFPDIIWDDYPEGLEYLCQLLSPKSST